LTVHLRATAGEYELLLESSSVRGVSGSGETAAWSDRNLPLLDLTATLGGGGATRSDRVVILYGDDADTITLAVDEVKGLVTLAANELARLPAVSTRFAQFFDAISVEPIDGRHPLRLRARIDRQALAREDA
jgi:chemotaxis signal transduction protein